jgi:predicted transcriptional regulator
MEGTKQVEFRKRAFGRQVSYVVVYSSSPVKQVVGFFEISGIDEASPGQLWRRYSQVGESRRATTTATSPKRREALPSRWARSMCSVSPSR